jgi:hypothetical protein
VTPKQYDAETTRLAYSMALRGDSPAEIAEVVTAREAERERLIAERDEANRQFAD